MRSNCTRATTGPRSIALSSGGPIRSVLMRSRTFRISGSAMLSCISSRDPAQHTCPWLNQMPSTRPSTALSRSASSKMMNGDFPPSSREIFLWLFAVAVRIARPTSVEPVKAILSTSACFTNASPVEPSPVTMFTTPAGNSISWQISANASAVSGVNSAGFKTTVFPVASAGAIFQASISRGKFQGMICPTTPQAEYPGNSCSSSCAQPA